MLALRCSCVLRTVLLLGDVVMEQDYRQQTNRKVLGAPGVRRHGSNSGTARFVRALWSASSGPLTQLHDFGRILTADSLEFS